MQSSEDCRRGCDTVLPSAEDQRLLTAPLAPPALVEKSTSPPRPAGLYRIDSYPTPSHDGSVQAGISGFLFKVEFNSTNLFLYQVCIYTWIPQLSKSLIYLFSFEQNYTLWRKSLYPVQMQNFRLYKSHFIQPFIFSTDLHHW